MSSLLSHLLSFVAGAGLMGVWWWWIGHRAKARAAITTAEQAAKKAGP